MDHFVQGSAFLQSVGLAEDPALQKRGWQNFEAGCGLEPALFLEGTRRLLTTVYPEPAQ